MSWCFVAGLLVVLGASVYTEDLPLVSCSSDEWCTIDAVSIDPCKEVPAACKLKRGHNATVSFTFTPKFEATQLSNMVYWASSIDLPFADMDGSGCKFTTCPTVPNAKQTFTYTLNIGKKLPTGQYPLKWNIWDSSNTERSCCFKASIRLVK